MIDIIVKMPSLSPTLKWLRVSLAPTWGRCCWWLVLIYFSYEIIILPEHFLQEDLNLATIKH
jgi:hypothetical protein